MYTRHFGFTAEPFSLTPDPDFLYLSAQHAEALAALKVGLLGKRGLMVMTGEVGTGKTTLLYALLRALGDGIRTAYVSNTALGFDGLLQLALTDFAVTPASPSRVDMLTALNHLLRDCADRGVAATLIVDEAQNLDAEAFEQLRLLSNFETFSHKLLQIVLVGQPELAVRLRDPALRALTERVAVHCRLEPLGERESRAYIDYRLLRAGGSTRLFEHDARDVLLAEAEGLPRRINILCHNALLFAYGRGAMRVTRPVAELAVAGRAALLHDEPVRQPAPPVGPPPSRRRGRRLALALGGAVLVAALALAGLRVPARQAGPDRLDAPAVLVADAHASLAAPLQGQALLAAPAADTETDSAAPAAAEPAAVTAAIDIPSPDGLVADPTRLPPDDPDLTPHLAMYGDDLAAAEAAPSSVRTVRVKTGSTLESLVRDVYGSVDPALIKRIQLANPQVVDPDIIMAGDLLRFPEFEPDHPVTEEVDRNE